MGGLVKSIDKMCKGFLVTHYMERSLWDVRHLYVIFQTFYRRRLLSGLLRHCLALFGEFCKISRMC